MSISPYLDVKVNKQSGYNFPTPVPLSTTNERSFSYLHISKNFGVDVPLAFDLLKE